MVLFMFHNSQITLLSSQSTQQSSYITIHNTILRTSQFQDGRSNEMGTSIMWLFVSTADSYVTRLLFDPSHKTKIV